MHFFFVLLPTVALSSPCDKIGFDTPGFSLIPLHLERRFSQCKSFIRELSGETMCRPDPACETLLDPTSDCAINDGRVMTRLELEAFHYVCGIMPEAFVNFAGQIGHWIELIMECTKSHQAAQETLLTGCTNALQFTLHKHAFIIHLFGYVLATEDTLPGWLVWFIQKFNIFILTTCYFFCFFFIISWIIIAVHMYFENGLWHDVVVDDFDGTDTAHEDPVLIPNEPESEEDGDVPEELTCIVCMERRRSRIFSPCGHLAMCGSCYRRSKLQKENLPFYAANEGYKCCVCVASVKVVTKLRIG